MHFRRLLYGLLALVTACVADRDPPAPSDARFFPLISGKERVYRVMDTTFQANDTLAQAYLRRERTGDPITDLSGRKVYLLDVDTSSAGIFSDDRVAARWTQFRDNAWAERTEETVRYLALKFPARTGDSWNGNTYNALGEQKYRYLSADTTVTVNGVRYEHCVVVEENRIDYLFTRDVLKYEIYAPGIGKIGRYFRDLAYTFEGGVLKFDPSNSHIQVEILISHNYE